MEGTLRSPRLLAVALLLLCTLPSYVDAQQFVCWPITPGDTASSLARRLTGKSAAAYSQAFQIRDPTRRMFVPKSHYQRLQSDWQACFAQGPVSNAPVAYAPEVELAAPAMVSEEPTITPTPQPLTSAPLALVRADLPPTEAPFPATAGAATVLVLLLSAVAGSLARRPIPPSVRRAGENFVAVFARPLIDDSSEVSPAVPPIRTRLRFIRRNQQLEIFIAPGPGHRYPNLGDHKNNLVYDVDRVVRVLGNYVVSRPLRAAGKWVVVTIAERQRNEEN